MTRLALLLLLAPTLAHAAPFWQDTVPVMVVSDSSHYPWRSWGLDTIAIGVPVRARIISSPSRTGSVLQMLWLLRVLPEPPRPNYREFREER